MVLPGRFPLALLIALTGNLRHRLHQLFVIRAEGCAFQRGNLNINRNQFKANVRFDAEDAVLMLQRTDVLQILHIVPLRRIVVERAADNILPLQQRFRRTADFAQKRLLRRLQDEHPPAPGNASRNVRSIRSDPQEENIRAPQPGGQAALLQMHAMRVKPRAEHVRPRRLQHGYSAHHAAFRQIVIIDG